MSKSCLFIVLAEDQRHVTFVRRHLYKLGHSYHEVRAEALPGGRGCGEQWVRERYADAVRAYRGRSARARTGLVVAIDADNSSVEQRTRQLQDALTEAGLSQRAANDRIAHLIPKRSVETWILCLGGSGVDEDTDYSRDADIDERISAAAETFFEWTRENATVPEHCVPSLRSAIPEAKRLE